MKNSKLISEASLSGNHRSGTTVLDYYVKTKDIDTKEFEVEKDTTLYDKSGNKTDKKVKKGDKLIILSKSPIKIGRTQLINIKIDNNSNFYISISAVRKPTTSSSFNRGDIAEGIISAAIAAKFLNPEKKISQNDVEDILKTMSKINNLEKIWTHKSKTSGTDKISLQINLKKDSADALFDVSNWLDLKTEFSGAIAYANSKHVQRYAALLDQNNTDDKAIISSDGAGNEKGTKVDMFVKIGLNGKKPKLTRLNVSLKSGQTKNLEQAGVSYEKISGVFERFGINIGSKEDKFSKDEKWYKDVFKLVVLELNKKLSRQKNDAKVMQTLVKGIKKTATKDDSSVIQVHLKSGTFKRFSFRNLFNKLNGIDLEAYYSDKSLRPKIGIRDTKTKTDIITFRIEVRKGKGVFKLHIEKGNLLSQLTEI